MQRNRKPRRRCDTYGADVEGSTQRLDDTTLDPVAARFGFEGVPLRGTILALLGGPIIIAIMYGICWLCYIVGKAVGTI